VCAVPPGLSKTSGTKRKARLSLGAQALGKIGLRLRQHAGPALLFEMKGLRAQARLVPPTSTK
jgi:hypothetical protein